MITLVIPARSGPTGLNGNHIALERYSLLLGNQYCGAWEACAGFEADVLKSLVCMRSFHWYFLAAEGGDVLSIAAGVVGHGVGVDDRYRKLDRSQCSQQMATSASTRGSVKLAGD